MAGLKVFSPPIKFGGKYIHNLYKYYNIKDIDLKLYIMLYIKSLSDIEYPERSRLKIVDRVPQYAPGLRPPKMQKRLRYMRGPEQVHNFLMYKQYGIVVSLYLVIKTNDHRKVLFFQVFKMSLLEFIGYRRR